MDTHKNRSRKYIDKYGFTILSVIKCSRQSSGIKCQTKLASGSSRCMRPPHFIPWNVFHMTIIRLSLAAPLISEQVLTAINR